MRFSRNIDIVNQDPLVESIRKVLRESNDQICIVIPGEADVTKSQEPEFFKNRFGVKVSLTGKREIKMCGTRDQIMKALISDYGFAMNDSEASSMIDDFLTESKSLKEGTDNIRMVIPKSMYKPNSATVKGITTSAKLSITADGNLMAVGYWEDLEDVLFELKLANDESEAEPLIQKWLKEERDVGTINDGQLQPDDKKFLVVHKVVEYDDEGILKESVKGRKYTVIGGKAIRLK